MNGIVLLLSYSLLAQSSIGPLGAGPSVSQANPALDSPAGLTQYGWQINAENELEYLIQISPEMLPFMTSTTDQKEFQSEIPRELAGRIQRVVVSIGTQILPRSPSLQEIQQRVPTIASLPGRFRDLEPDVPVAHVNNNQFPEPPTSFGGSTDRSGGGGASNPSVPSIPLGNAFMDQARAGTAPLGSVGGRPTSGAPPLSNSNPMHSGTSFNSGQPGNTQLAMPSNQGIPPGSVQSGSLPQSGRFADTAAMNGNPFSQPAGMPPQTGQPPPGGNGWQAAGNPLPMPSTNAGGNWAGNQNPGASQWPSGHAVSDPYSLHGNPATSALGNNSNNAGGQFPSGTSGSFQQPGFASGPGNAQQSGYPEPSGYAQQQNYVQNPSYANQVRDFQRQGSAFPSTSGGGFGDITGTPGQSLADRARESDRWNSSSATGSTMGRPGDTLVASRPRDSLAMSDTARSPEDLQASASANPRGSFSNRGDFERQEQRQTVAGSENNHYHLFVFFVLSVAVNLWMVHLLRSLYLRYRTLLTSLRSQAV